jgi:hypothetical protein
VESDYIAHYGAGLEIEADLKLIVAYPEQKN